MNEPGDPTQGVENARLRGDLARCLRFIHTIPDDNSRLPEEKTASAWTRELRAIKREVKA